MKPDLVLLLALGMGGLAAACLWGLIWIGQRPPGSSAALPGAPMSRSPSLSLYRLRPLLNAIEPRLSPWSSTRWGRAVLAHDTALIVRSGLQGDLHAGQILAWRVSLLVAAGGLALGVAVLITLAQSLTLEGQSALSARTVLWIGGLAAIIGAWWPERWLRLKRIERERALLKHLPFVLDLLTLSVESGASLAAALGHAAEKGPQGPLRDEIQRTLLEVRSGVARAEALRAMALRIDLPAISNWVAAMVSAQQQGSSLGPVLRAQADQRREERFLRAEKAAMKAPVKMLFPLLVFIFPCTFLLLFFPVAVRLMQEGLLR